MYKTLWKMNKIKLFKKSVGQWNREQRLISRTSGGFVPSLQGLSLSSHFWLNHETCHSNCFEFLQILFHLTFTFPCAETPISQKMWSTLWGAFIVILRSVVHNILNSSGIRYLKKSWNPYEIVLFSQFNKNLRLMMLTKLFKLTQD